MIHSYTLLDSPVGGLLIAGDDGYLRLIVFQAGKQPMAPQAGWERGGRIVDEARRQLAAYFRGRLQAFHLPLAPAGTPFQRRVWRALEAIPYGETLAYGELAERLGKPQAARAVGAANGRNPIPIVIPCHRVIGKDGTLTGFGGGLPIKKRLLELERRHLAPHGS